MALRDHYKRVGANERKLLEYEGDIQNLYYYGEKNPHMWWEYFEARLAVPFHNIDRNEGRFVYYNISRLRMLHKGEIGFLRKCKDSN